MQCLPGTTVEVHENNTAQGFLDSAFSMGGLVLSQVTQLTGLEPHTVQNWVKRGFITPPRQKKYDCDQFCRIAVINMFKDVFRIERIAAMLDFVERGGAGVSDRLVYTVFSDVIGALPGDAIGAQADIGEVTAAEAGKHGLEPRALERVKQAVYVMVLAFISVRVSRRADMRLKQLEEQY